MKTLTIQPVTRIEGGAKVTIQLDDAGNVADAKMPAQHTRRANLYRLVIWSRTFGLTCIRWDPHS